MEVKDSTYGEAYYEGSNISFQERGARSKSSRICISFLNIYGRSKIW